MLQTRPYGLVPPNLPALYPSGHGACTVRSTRVFVSDFVAAPVGRSGHAAGRLTSFGSGIHYWATLVFDYPSPPSGWDWTLLGTRVIVPRAAPASSRAVPGTQLNTAVDAHLWWPPLSFMLGVER